MSSLSSLLLSSLELIDTKIYEPYIQALLETAPHMVCDKSIRWEPKFTTTKLGLEYVNARSQMKFQNVTFCRIESFLQYGLEIVTLCPQVARSRQRPQSSCRCQASSSQFRPRPQSTPQRWALPSGAGYVRQRWASFRARRTPRAPLHPCGPHLHAQQHLQQLLPRVRRDADDHRARASSKGAKMSKFVNNRHFTPPPKGPFRPLPDG